MAKPIFTVGVSKRLSKEFCEEINYNLEAEIGDEYHVLVYQTNQDELKMQCFFEKDFNEVKFEELKEIVKKEMKR